MVNNFNNYLYQNNFPAAGLQEELQQCSTDIQKGVYIIENCASDGDGHHWKQATCNALYIWLQSSFPDILIHICMETNTTAL